MPPLPLAAGSAWFRIYKRLVVSYFNAHEGSGSDKIGIRRHKGAIKKYTFVVGKDVVNYDLESNADAEEMKLKVGIHGFRMPLWRHDLAGTAVPDFYPWFAFHDVQRGWGSIAGGEVS